MSRSYTIGSLFSGIGGLELGLERAGLGPVLWQVEIDPFARRVLTKHWPDARRYEDVRAVGAGVLAEVDVICGGFPCQDISLAGAGAGLAGERSGLWFEYLRIVRELRPRAVVIENVAALERRGLDVVVAGLDDAGFAVEGIRLRASDVGAPHRRERIFLVAIRRGVADSDRGGRRPDGFARVGGAVGVGGVDPVHATASSDAGAGRLAHARSLGFEGPGCEQGEAREGWRAALGGGEGAPARLAHAHGEGQLQQGGPVAEQRGRAGDCGGGGVLGYPDGSRLEGRGLPGGRGADERAAGSANREGAGLPAGPAEPRLGRGTDGFPAGLDGRWPAGRGQPQHPWEPPRTARGVPNRAGRLKALGNAVVPACAEVVGRRVLKRLRGAA